jgi:hypothetical protein
MIGTSVPDTSTTDLLSREVDDLLLHVRGLALVREVLAERGTSSAEIRAHSDALERLRGELAEMIRG